MKGARRRIVLWAVLALMLAGGLAYAFWPRPVAVDFAEVTRGPLVVTIEGEGKTRVREVYQLSAPISGRALRIETHVGDMVKAGDTVVAAIQPEDPAFLDVRSEAQARAAVDAAIAARALAEADLQRQRAEHAFAEAELDRTRRLFDTKTVAKRTLDAAERTERTARAGVKTAEAALRMRGSELEEARARLITANEGSKQDVKSVPVRAPVSGQVLRVLHESEGVVRAGEPLIEIGDPADLEIVVDLLSSDAVKVAAGQRVFVTEWGGPDGLEGRLRRVEPYGFTKVSALGIEEQRVNAIIDLVSPQSHWGTLGHGYQVTTHIVISEGEALIAPLTALFRRGNQWTTFVVSEGRARAQALVVGRLNTESAEILEGLAAGDQLVAHPSDRVTDGVLVE